MKTTIANLSKNMAFPVAPESFVKYQAALVGRELFPNEIEAVSSWVPAFNLSFEEGQKNDASALGDSLNLLDELIKNEAGYPVLERFLKSCRFWVMYAWKQGRAGETT